MQVRIFDLYNGADVVAEVVQLSTNEIAGAIIEAGALEPSEEGGGIESIELIFGADGRSGVIYVLLPKDPPRYWPVGRFEVLTPIGRRACGERVPE